MRVPDGPTGYPTVSISQLRTYGAGGEYIEGQEDDRGCPRLYRAKYVDRTVPRQVTYPLAYGTFVHQVLYLIEGDGLTPQEAIEASFGPGDDPAMLTEIRADLDRYLSRGATPSDVYATIGTEVELDAVLFHLADGTPLMFRGIIDRLMVDPEDPGTVHVVDYKTNRFPPSTADVEGDMQLKSYAWLVLRNLGELGISHTSPRVVVHLDAIKWGEIEVTYGPDVLDDWHTWACAVVRGIVDDEDAEPVINPGCGYCPIRWDCPAYTSLPATAAGLAGALPGIDDLEARVAWRDAASKVRLLLEKAVAEIDAGLAAQALTSGEFTVGESTWSARERWSDLWDLSALHGLLGDRFYRVVNVVKSRVAEECRDDPSLAAQADACRSRIARGVQVVRRKADNGNAVHGE